MWSTNDGFKKDPSYKYTMIPRYFKVGTVSDPEKTSSYVSQTAVGFYGGFY